MRLQAGSVYLDECISAVKCFGLRSQVINLRLADLLLNVEGVLTALVLGFDLLFDQPAGAPIESAEVADLAE